MQIVGIIIIYTSSTYCFVCNLPICMYILMQFIATCNKRPDPSSKCITPTRNAATLYLAFCFFAFFASSN